MELLLSLVTHPMFASFLLAGIVPFLYRSIEEAGVTIPSKLKVWLNLGLSTMVAFVPLVVTWVLTGVPNDPEVIFGSITTAAVMSELLYRTYWKKEQQ